MVWAEQEVKNKDGTTARFLVQDVTPDKHDHIMDLFEEGFWNKEVMCRSLRLPERDPKSWKGFFLTWLQDCLRQNVSRMVLEETRGGRQEVVAAQVLRVLATETTTSDDEEAFPFTPGCAGEAVFRVLSAVGSLPAGQLRSPHYLGGFGICVRPDRSGSGLATTVLRTLPALCAALELPAYRGTFTGPASQAAAKRAGFQEFGEIRYEDFKDEDGSPIFKDLDFSCKLMGFNMESDRSREPLRKFDS